MKTPETDAETMGALARTYHSIGPSPEPTAIVWQCVMGRLSRVPTEAEQTAFRDAWTAEHKAWTVLLGAHVPERRPT